MEKPEVPRLIAGDPLVTELLVQIDKCSEPDALVRAIASLYLRKVEREQHGRERLNTSKSIAKEIVDVLPLTPAVTLLLKLALVLPARLELDIRRSVLSISIQSALKSARNALDESAGTGASQLRLNAAFNELERARNMLDVSADRPRNLFIIDLLQALFASQLDIGADYAPMLYLRCAAALEEWHAELVRQVAESGALERQAIELEKTAAMFREAIRNGKEDAVLIELDGWPGPLPGRPPGEWPQVRARPPLSLRARRAEDEARRLRSVAAGIRAEEAQLARVINKLRTAAGKTPAIKRPA